MNEVKRVFKWVSEKAEMVLCHLCLCPKEIRQKWEHGTGDKMNDWKERANKLFFNDKLNINQISEVLGISRKSISKYLATVEGYKKEKEERKKINREKRREYKREWDRVNRLTVSQKITQDDLKRDHEMAVRILSAEKYH